MAELSVTEILTNLQTQMSFHREREAFHAEQEVFHREQRALHAAEYEAIARGYEAFKASADLVGEIAARSAVPVPAPAPEEKKPEEERSVGKPALRSQLVAQVIAELPAGEVFNASRLASEVNRRFGKTLPKPADARLASAALRRLYANGRVRLVKKGTSHHEALYSRV
jgi:hypothetical protein